VPTAPAVAASEAGLRVAVNRTYATGPLNVSVTAAGSGEPIDATVSIEDRTVGRTGSKGYLWAISLRGTINVTVADGNRTATVRLAADPRLAAGDGEARSSIAARTPSPPESRPTTPVNESTPPANRSTLLANGSTSLRNESALPLGTPPTGSRADSPIANGSDQNATATTAGNRSAPAIAPWVSA
jgi:hypothetical protein